MKRITALHYNWYFSQENSEVGFTAAEVGKDGVVSIEECQGYYEYERAHYRIHYEDGSERRIYNTNEVFLEPVPAPPIQSDPDIPF